MFVYGAAVPALSVTDASFVNAETAANLATPVAISSTATAASGVGTYAVTASGATSPNYTIAFVPGVATVAPASLTITADNKTLVAGTAVPPLTASYAGFVNGDAVASLDRPVTLATTATPASVAGVYPIVASGAADVNDAITFVAGQLSVTSLRAERAAVRQSLCGAPADRREEDRRDHQQGDRPHQRQPRGGAVVGCIAPDGERAEGFRGRAPSRGRADEDREPEPR